MTDELSALHNSGTWELVPLLSGKSIVGCKWVFAIKVGPDGTIDRLKAHLVAKGLKQHIYHHFQTKDLGKLRYFLGIEVA